MVKKVKAVTEQRTVNDLDITLNIRSSRLKLRELSQLYQLIIDNLSTESRQFIVVDLEQSVNQNHDRTLYTITVKLQTPD